MKLTAELINSSLSFTNPLKERELDLRGHRIRYIENLGVAKDQECIDLTDNDISDLENFPLSPRLHTLLCAGNRVSRISPSLATMAPNIHTIVLTSNSLQDLSQLTPLQGFTRLQHLSLVGNPVTREENYRLYLIHLSPTIRFLDFQKVKDTERRAAKELFGTRDAPTELARGFLGGGIGGGSHTLLTGGNFSAKNGIQARGDANGTATGGKLELTEAQRTKLQALLRDAKSLAEVERIEGMVSRGRLPEELRD